MCTDFIQELSRKHLFHYSGAAEQGQLGRVPECFTQRGGRRGLGECYCCDFHVLLPWQFTFSSLNIQDLVYLSCFWMLVHLIYVIWSQRMACVKCTCRLQSKLTVTFKWNIAAFLLTPALVSCKKRSVRFCNIWTGSYYTFAKDKDTGDIYAWGLNNYYQLGNGSPVVYCEVCLM